MPATTLSRALYVTATTGSPSTPPTGAFVEDETWESTTDSEAAEVSLVLEESPEHAPRATIATNHEARLRARTTQA